MRDFWITARVGGRWLPPRLFRAPDVGLALWCARGAFGPLADSWRVLAPVEVEKSGT